METVPDTKASEQQEVVAPVNFEVNNEISNETENQQMGSETEEVTEKSNFDFVVPSLPSKSKEPTEKDDENIEITGKDGTKKIEYEERTKEKDKAGFPLPEPTWGGLPETSEVPYSLTILKDGIVKDTVNLMTNSRFTFGRHDRCSVLVEHPSCSRYHAALQYCLVEKDIRKKGFYLYDMGSTHGTYLNKQKVKAKVYNRVRVGYQIKFGGSTRLYIVEVSGGDAFIFKMVQLLRV